MEVDEAILRDIHKKLEDINNRLARREHYDDMVLKHDKLLYGNGGNPGLKSTVDRNDSRIKWIMGGVGGLFTGAVAYIVKQFG